MLSLPSLSLQMPPNPSTETIRQKFKENGLYPRRVCKKPLLTGKHMRDRLKFACQFKSLDWRKVIFFCDEKIFRICPADAVRCWRPKGKRFVGKYVEKKTQSNMGLMVWCAINSKGKLCLRRCPQRVNAWAYRSILRGAMRFLKPKGRFVSHQGALCIHFTPFHPQNFRPPFPTRWLPCAQGFVDPPLPPEKEGSTTE